MRTPAAPGPGQAGERIERQTTAYRTFTTARNRGQTPAIGVPPNWQHIGKLADAVLARISVVST